MLPPLVHFLVVDRKGKHKHIQTYRSHGLFATVGANCIGDWLTPRGTFLLQKRTVVVLVNEISRFFLCERVNCCILHRKPIPKLDLIVSLLNPAHPLPHLSLRPILIPSYSKMAKWPASFEFPPTINKRMLRRTVFIDKIRMLQWTRRNSIGRRSTRVRMTFRTSPFVCLYFQ